MNAFELENCFFENLTKSIRKTRFKVGEVWFLSFKFSREREISNEQLEVPSWNLFKFGVRIQFKIRERDQMFQ